MRGSGWLVGPYTVITAGHCVWDREHGNDYSQSMQVYPARNGNISPRVANAVDFITVSGWSNHGDTVCDYGAVFLDEPLGDEFGFFAYAEEPDEDLRNMLIHVVGYPATIESGGRELVVDPPTLWGQVNRIRDVREQELGYTIDTTPGQSGCPVICWEGEDQFRVVGIHNEGSAGENFATRISAVVYDNIKKWKSWRPAN